MAASVFWQRLQARRRIQACGPGVASRRQRSAPPQASASRSRTTPALVHALVASPAHAPRVLAPIYTQICSMHVISTPLF